MVNVLFHLDFIYKRSKLYQEERESMNGSERLPQEIIDARKVEFFKKRSTANVEHKTDADVDEFSSPQIFIDQLFELYAKGAIDDRAIKDQVNLMIFAGNDTSALTLSHAVVLLAMHPDIQRRAAAEVDRVLIDENVSITYDHVTQFVYIEQVLRETLRLFPVAPYLLRFCTADTQISRCIIPRGATIIVSLMTMQRNKAIWGDDADQFNPDHFCVEEMSKRNPNAFAAFSLGPRNCIGMRYALISMKIMLASLLRQFKFTTHLTMDDIKTKFEITLKFECGDVVQVTRRQK